MHPTPSDPSSVSVAITQLEADVERFAALDPFAPGFDDTYLALQQRRVDLAAYLHGELERYNVRLNELAELESRSRNAR